MGYVNISVKKPSKAGAGAPEGKDTAIIFIDAEDVLQFPERDSKGVLMVGNFVMKPGKYAIAIYGTSSSIKPSKSSDGEEDAVGFMHGLELSHPGDELEINEFIQNWTNRKIITLIGSCSGVRKKAYGTKCAPLVLKYEGQDDADALKNTLKLEGSRKTNVVPGFYDGTVTYAAVLGVQVVDATVVDVAAGSGEYQLSDSNTVATELTSLSNAVDGQIVTLLGGGGANPTSITDGGDFVLKDGAAWSGIDGAIITFKVFKDGAASYKYIEQSRL